MSAHVVVIATDLRRTTVKVTPGTYLIDVLQQACKKFNLDGDKYLIKHKQKQVDLSIPFRTSGLLTGAKLELVQKSNTPSAIQIALQLPHPEAKEIPGGRLIRKFPSDLTLWKILRQFESGDANAGRNINITARGVARTANGSGAGQLYYEIPVLNIMGRDFASLTDFQKTMSQLGHNSGNILIRLTFKKTEQTLYDAMNQITEFFKDTDDSKPVEAGTPSTTQEDEVQRQSAPPSDDTPMKDEPAKSANTPQHPQSLISQQATKSTDSEAASSSETSAALRSTDPYAPVSVFLAPSGATPAAALAPAEEIDYTPTIAHAQLHQARLQESSRNKRLLSDKELEEKAAAEEAKLSAIKFVLVKIRFPDNTSSDWQVDHSTTGAFLYQAVRHVMAHREQPFHLLLPGSKTIIKDDESQKHNLIKVYKLSGRVLISLVWNDKVPLDIRKRPFLKSHVAQQAKQIEVQDVPQLGPEDEEDKAESSEPTDKKKDGSRRGDEGSGKKLPKWLKLGKK